MEKRKFFEAEDEEAIWEMAGWDLPGLTTRRAGFRPVNPRGRRYQSNPARRCPCSAGFLPPTPG